MSPANTHGNPRKPDKSPTLLFFISWTRSSMALCLNRKRLQKLGSLGPWVLVVAVFHMDCRKDLSGILNTDSTPSCKKFTEQFVIPWMAFGKRLFGTAFHHKAPLINLTNKTSMCWFFSWRCGASSRWRKGCFHLLSDMGLSKDRVPPYLMVNHPFPS